MTRQKAIMIITACLSLLAVHSASALAAANFPTTKAGPEKAFEMKQKTIHVYTINGQKVECAKAVFKGKTPPATGSSELTLVPTYSECKFAGESAKVAAESCEFQLGAPVGKGGGFTETFTITNKTTTCKIHIVATLFGIGCDVQFEEISKLTTVTQNVLAGNLGLVFGFQISGLLYTATGGGCGLAGISSGKEGKYTGEAETEAVYVK